MIVQIDPNLAAATVFVTVTVLLGIARAVPEQSQCTGHPSGRTT
jgi:hypothetical protein